MSDNLHKRTTSHAKTVALNDEKTALERARGLKEEFDRAKAAHEHPRDQEKALQPDLNERTTSHAKTVDLNEPENALDRARSLKEEFNRASAAPEHSREQEKTRPADKTGGPVYALKPEPHLRPAGGIRRTVDKQIDKEQRERERQRVKELSKAYKDGHERQKALDLDNDRHKSRHLGR